MDTFYIFIYITCTEMDTFSLIAMKLSEKTRAKTLLIFDMKIFIILIINFFVTDEMNKMLLKRIINLLRWRTFMVHYKLKTLIIHKLSGKSCQPKICHVE